MDLWYTTPDLDAAKKEARRLIEQYNKELPQFIRGGKVEIRMAWRKEILTREPPCWFSVARDGNPFRPIYIPEAELLFNGEVVKKDLLDLILIDINHLELKAILRARSDS